tara:strand:- start:443 stop:562 length:120 start_codon:yes stop_codon:yes gene_type:complete
MGELPTGRRLLFSFMKIIELTSFSSVLVAAIRRGLFQLS